MGGGGVFPSPYTCDDGLNFFCSARVSLTGAFALVSFLCFLNNGIYLLFHLELPHKGGVSVVGLVGPFLGLDEAALYDLAYHHFEGAGRCFS